VLFHVLHPDELALPFRELTLFESMEGTKEILVDPGGIRKAYLAEMERFLARTLQSCLEGEIEYHLISTAQPLDEVLLSFLSREGSKHR
jgi:hypothetical protein